MSPEKLKVLCDYSLELVRIRQSEVAHLCTENMGAEALSNVIAAYKDRYCPSREVEYHLNPLELQKGEG